MYVIQEWPVASKLVHFFVSKTHTIWSSNPTNGPRGQWKEKLGNGLSHSSIEAVGINYEHWPLTEGEGCLGERSSHNNYDHDCKSCKQLINQEAYANEQWFPNCPWSNLPLELLWTINSKANTEGKISKNDAFPIPGFFQLILCKTEHYVQLIRPRSSEVNFGLGLLGFDCF